MQVGPKSEVTTSLNVGPTCSLASSQSDLCTHPWDQELEPWKVCKVTTWEAGWKCCPQSLLKPGRVVDTALDGVLSTFVF